ncbi:family 16 glycosylhydrolase [Bacteroidota bacterium]
MNNQIKILAASFLLLSLISSVSVSLSGQCYELLWAEEFNYRGLPDPNTWNQETGGDGFGNNEAQYYTLNDTDNVYVNDSILIITALNEEYGNRSYTSARITTRENITFQYGRIEARIKLPYGQGIWPAFWIMGANIGEVGWPACGETDIMEMVGGEDSDNRVHGTVHWEHSGDHASYGGPYTLDSGIFADTFHIFSVEWSPEYIRWYVDNEQYHVIDIRGSELSEFHQDFFIILNLAVGGNWPGYPDETTVFPQTLEVDYIRIYKKPSYIENFEISGDDVVAQNNASGSYSLPEIPGFDYSWDVTGDVSILNGQGTNEIELDWACNSDTVKAEITGACKTYSFSKIVDVHTEINAPQFIKENEENVLFFVPEMHNTTYAWSVPNDVTIISTQTDDSLVVNWGQTFEEVSLNVSNSCGDSTYVFTTIKHDQYPYPSIYEPHSIPGIIKAVEYDYGGEGLSYHDSSTGNSGDGPRQDTDVDTELKDNGNPNVGYITSGEYLKYTIAADSNSYYKLVFRSASQYTSGGIMGIYINDELRLDSVAAPFTSSWEEFKYYEAGVLYLSTEDTVLKVHFIKGGMNLSELRFTLTDPPVNVKEEIQEKIKVYPVPSSDMLYVSGLEGFSTISVYNMQGKRIEQITDISGTTCTLNISEYNGGVYILRIVNSLGYHWTGKFIKSI